jgi:vacuolar-type H+-ATPase subunit H
MNASIKTLKYDDMDITNAYGQVELSNGRLNFNRLAFNALDGSMSMTGYYFANNSKEGKVNLSIDAKSIDIQKTFKTFNTVQKLAPIAEQSSGKISASFSLTTDLDGQMNPVMNSINSNGNIFTQNVVLTGSTVMNKTADLLKNSELKRLIIDNAKLLFEVNDGRVNVKPFDVKFGKIGLNIGGFTTFDQLIDYTFKISIPQSLLGAGAAGTIQGFTQNLSGKESANTTLDLTALVGGTFLKPEVKISLQSFKDNLKDAINERIGEVKTEVKENVQKVVDDAKQKAREAADKILAEAQAKANVIKSEAKNLADKTVREGYAAAQKLEDEAKNPISKKAAKVAADKMRSETDEKAARIVKEGDNKANQLMAAAQKQANDILNKP